MFSHLALLVLLKAGLHVTFQAPKVSHSELEGSWQTGSCGCSEGWQSQLSPPRSDISSAQCASLHHSHAYQLE